MIKKVEQNDGSDVLIGSLKKLTDHLTDKFII